MDAVQTADGQQFIRNIARFIRKHEQALANSLQLSTSKRPVSVNGSNASLSSTVSTLSHGNISRKEDSFASVFSTRRLTFSHKTKRAQLTLTPHHLYFLLARMAEMDIQIGPMSVRLENIHTDPSPTNYVSFLQTHKLPSQARRDSESQHSVSSVRSVFSTMSSIWLGLGLGSATSKSEKAKAAVDADLKYLYSAFTKIPSLRFSPDHNARLITGYEEFPFDTAVPLFAFKNLQQLDIIDIDFRQFYGWDRLADQLVLLTLKRAKVDDPADLITNIVLDDTEKRRRRSNHGSRGSPTPSWTVPSPSKRQHPRSNSDSDSPTNASPRNGEVVDYGAKAESPDQVMVGSISPKRPNASRPGSSYRHVRSYSTKMKRSGSRGSISGEYTTVPHRSNSSSSLLSMNILPPTKWLRLKYLSLADNALTSISAKSLLPLSNTLRSLNLASNLFTDIPDGLAVLTSLNSLDLSNCMIDSLKNPLPAISTLRLRSNRLHTLAGIEHLKSLENLDIAENFLSDPMEAARLTEMPNFRKLWLEGNPLVKPYSSYRITIFNLFRNTPGHLEDIIIDGREPEYSERKLLVERVPEKERPMVVRSITITEPPTTEQAADSRSSLEPSKAGVKIASDQSDDFHISSMRRKKGSRRRIVDLSQDEPETVVEFLDVQGVAVAPTEKKPNSTQNNMDLHHIFDPTPEIQALPNSDGVDVFNSDSHTDIYRQKIESLKQQFGSNWISILGEQGWQGEHEGIHPRISSQPSLTHYANTPIIVNSKGALG